MKHDQQPQNKNSKCQVLRFKRFVIWLSISANICQIVNLGLDVVPYIMKQPPSHREEVVQNEKLAKINHEEKVNN